MKQTWMVLFVLAGCPSEYVDDPLPTPIAHDDHLTASEDSSGELTAIDVLANDENVNSALDKVTILEPPLHGKFVSVIEGFTTVPGYVADPGYHGPDQFTYEVRNGDGGAATATVTIDIVSDGIRYENATLLDDTRGSGIAAGDVTGDGLVDIVVTNPGSSEVVVLVNRTTVANEFVTEPLRFEGGRSPVGIAVVDLDGDGRLDIVTAAGDDGLVILRNITSLGGQLGFAAPLLVPSGITSAVVAVDLDADGRPDLASVDAFADTLDVHLNTSSIGSIAFGVRTSFATPAGPVQVLVNDVSRDGSPDLAVLAAGTQIAPDGVLTLFVNATSVGATVPAFAARVDRATATEPTNMFVADLDGDARDELVVQHVNNDLWIFANNSSGPGSPTFEAARVLEPPVLNGRAVAVDLDGAGPIDILIAVPNGQPFVQLRNLSAPGTFTFDVVEGEIGDTVARSRVKPGRPTALVLADLDGVGGLEIVFSTRFDWNGSVDGTYVLFDR